MKISVVIPTYNSAAVIRATLDSVLRQTSSPDEILVLDDGSTDNTVAILDSYRPLIKVLQQKNQGVAPARNALARSASGDLLAFLDHDDLWHPEYLETQRRLLEENPGAVAAFTGHVDFEGYADFDWKTNSADEECKTELIHPLSFLERYNVSTGLFGSMSFCCVRKQVLKAIGDEPFCVSGVDDSYLCTLLPLFGPVVYSSRLLVAYRLTREAQSANRLKSLRLWVTALEQLEECYLKLPDAKLRRAFLMALAAKRRWYAKLLMGSGNVAAAREQLVKNLRRSGSASSLAKSFSLWFLTHLPARFQPAWPPASREVALSAPLPAREKLPVNQIASR